MTPQQRTLVRTSFDAIRDQAGPVGLLFYGKLFELDPSARRLFHVDLAVQVRKLMDTLDWVVASLDDFDPMKARLAELGRQHAGYGVRFEQYDTLVVALVWAIGQALGPDFDMPTRAAWKAALDAVGNAMKDGVSATNGNT
jgi:hemoglobin-like flavoprotein